MSLVREFNLVRKRLSKDNNDEGRKALNKENHLRMKHVVLMTMLFREGHIQTNGATGLEQKRRESA